MEFSQSQTKKNMARAFAGLCQDSARLKFMSIDALNEEMIYISTLLKRISEEKIGQAKRLYDLINENLENKKDNIVIEAGYPFQSSKIKIGLEQGSITEEFESKNLFPQFAKIAKDEGFENISNLFLLIANVSQTNFRILKSLAENYQNKTLYKDKKNLQWTCCNCGNTITQKQSWKNCPLCGKNKGFTIIPKEKLEF